MSGQSGQERGINAAMDGQNVEKDLVFSGFPLTGRGGSDNLTGLGGVTRPVLSLQGLG
jgi:hypothetical protein